MDAFEIQKNGVNGAQRVRGKRDSQADRQRENRGIK